MNFLKDFLNSLFRIIFPAFTSHLGEKMRTENIRVTLRYHLYH